MHTITFKFNEDVRSFKKDQVKKIEINDNGLVWLVGDNKCGKSTLLQLMRSRKNALKDTKEKIGSDYMAGAVQVLRDVDVTIEGLDAYDNICYMDAIVDDPLSMENSAECSLYIEGGGFFLKKMSKGEKALTMLGMFGDNIDKTIGQNTGHNLIVFDEIDEGFDVKFQSAFIRAIKSFRKRFNADVICVTHSIVPILMSDVQEVYSVPTEKYCRLDTYLSCMVSKKVDINVRELNEEEYAQSFRDYYGFEKIDKNKDQKGRKSAKKKSQS